MTRWGNRVLSMLLWSWGGTVYFLMEVGYKSITGHPERISWTMLVLAILLSVPLERFGAELPWSMPLMLQAAICTVAITATELVAGLILNTWLGLGVWDYSHLPLNLWGQICAQYALLWYILCLIFIPVFDWLRYAVEGGEKPHYT